MWQQLWCDRSKPGQSGCGVASGGCHGEQNGSWLCAGADVASTLGGGSAAGRAPFTWNQLSLPLMLGVTDPSFLRLHEGIWGFSVVSVVLGLQVLTQNRAAKCGLCCVPGRLVFRCAWGNALTAAVTGEKVAYVIPRKEFLSIKQIFSLY